MHHRNLDPFVFVCAMVAILAVVTRCSPAAVQEERSIAGDVVKVTDAACAVANLAKADPEILALCAKEASSKPALQTFVSQCRAELADGGSL